MRHKSKYNNLCDQFNNNTKYKLRELNKIPEKEDISYQMSVKSKDYQSSFYQTPDDDGLTKRIVWFTIKKLEGHYFLLLFYDNEYNHDTTNEL